MQPDTSPQFIELKPARDWWKLTWKVVIGVNVALIVLFLILITLKLVGVNVTGLGEFAIVTSFWLLPLLLVADIAVLASYILVKQPKGRDLLRPIIWVAGTGLAAFLTISVYVGIASVS
jgi:hypothetical protein